MLKSFNEICMSLWASYDSVLDELHCTFITMFLARGFTDENLMRTYFYCRNSHSKIEKRRRDKINLQITELARILPMSPFIRSRRLDKLSVLKMTVQYMKMMRSATDLYTEGRYKHPLISDKDLSNLINKVSLVLLNV